VENIIESRYNKSKKFVILGATDDVCNISYAMVEEAIQVLFSIYYHKKLTVHRFMENFENLVD
jgi:hypothetical protein